MLPENHALSAPPGAAAPSDYAELYSVRLTAAALAELSRAVDLAVAERAVNDATAALAANDRCPFNADGSIDLDVGVDLEDAAHAQVAHYREAYARRYLPVASPVRVFVAAPTRAPHVRGRGRERRPRCVRRSSASSSSAGSDPGEPGEPEPPAPEPGPAARPHLTLVPPVEAEPTDRQRRPTVYLFGRGTGGAR